MVASPVFLVALLAAAACALPAQQRYMWMPDGNGLLHLVDLTQEEPTQRLDGAKDVTLNLYTQKNPTSAQIIQLNNVPSNFDASKPTRFVIHGWNSAASHMDHIRQAYIATGSGYNVILVDWSGKASAIYSSARSSALEVGKYVAEVVNNLISLKGLNLNTLYIIGHSLGAHAAGVAGYNLNSKLARVVGLDAAAPLFGSTSLPNRLDATDAQFVEAIHTNGGLLGWEDPLADADFFPNGGSSQTGCGLDVGGSCSHSRSHQYYAESITSKNFVGTQCSTYKQYSSGSCSSNPTAIMGEWTPTSASGSYWLDTNKSSPYAKG
ncbi:Phospholipase A1 1 [Gryllus bimaculatus]|nr:Phospholipase A1 1 [Gryllus bimaculatus]